MAPPLPPPSEDGEAGTAAMEQRRVEFALGRNCARLALAALGAPSTALTRSANGVPLWPDGFTGSISHCASLGCAAVGRARDVRGLGIDVEPAEPFEKELVQRVCRRDELQRIAALGKAAKTACPILSKSGQTTVLGDCAKRWETIEPGAALSGGACGGFATDEEVSPLAFQLLNKRLVSAPLPDRREPVVNG